MPGAALYNNVIHLKHSKAVPLYAMEALGGRGRIAPTHSWPRHSGWVVSVTPRPRFARGKDPRYPLYRRLGGPLSRSEHRGWRKNPLPLPGIEPRSPGRPVRSQTLYCLSYSGSHLKHNSCLYLMHHNKNVTALILNNHLIVHSSTYSTMLRLIV
jgi:hypothetical protein